MEIIIIGAGNVGYTLARTLSQKHDVLLIEEDEKRYNYVAETLDVGALQANGASPKILEKVITDKTRLFLAVTEMDEINIFACLNARKIKPEITTVARVRNPDYTDGEDASGFMDVDFIISPEMLTARKMLKIALVDNAIDYESIPDLDIEVVTFKIDWCHRDVVDRPIKDLIIPHDSVIVAIQRNYKIIIPKPEDVLLPDDRVTVIGRSEAVCAFNHMLGTDRRRKNFIIIGGGIVGEYLIDLLKDEKVDVKLIEKDEERCMQLAKRFNHAIIINANGADPNVLRLENLEMADVLLCSTDSEEENLLGCLIGKNFGVGKVISRYSRRDYEGIFKMTGIETAIGYHQVVANEIIKRTVPEYKVLLLFDNFAEEFVGITITDKTRVRGKKINEVPLPEGAIIAMVVKDGEAVIAMPETIIDEGDMVLVFAHTNLAGKLEKVFSKKIPIVP